MRHLFFAAAIGTFIGFVEPACGGACAGSHCCNHDHCNCLGSHCCAAPGVDAPDGHTCEALRRDFECQVSFRDGNGDEIGSDLALYEGFAYQEGAIETCAGFEADHPNAPDGTVSAACSCAPVDDETPGQLRTPE
jgi:hypothetical protein